MVVIGLTSCASFPITSMYKLRNFDLATTDLTLLRFAVRAPNDITIPKNGFQLVLSTTHEERPSLKEVINLEQINDATALRNLEREGTHVLAFRIASEDVERFNQFRYMIRIEKDFGAEGSLDIEMSTCRTTSKIPSYIPISTFVNASETQGYVALMRDVDLLNKGRHKTLEELLPECTSR